MRKNVPVIFLIMLIVALILVACQGDEGASGPEGAEGAQGNPGPAGVAARFHGSLLSRIGCVGQPPPCEKSAIPAPCVNTTFVAATNYWS